MDQGEKQQAGSTQQQARRVYKAGRKIFWMHSNTQHENQGLGVTRYLVYSCLQNLAGPVRKSNWDHKFQFMQCFLLAELKMVCKCF